MQYPLIELFIATIAVVLFLVYGSTGEYLINLLYLTLMFVIALIDCQYLIIPNKIIVTGITLGLFLIGVFYPEEIISRLFSSLYALSSMLLLLFAGSWLFKRPAMGLGDIKLAALISLFLGFQNFLVSLWLAALFGSMYGIILKYSTTSSKFHIGLSSLTIGHSPFTVNNFTRHLIGGSQFYPPSFWRVAILPAIFLVGRDFTLRLLGGSQFNQGFNSGAKLPFGSFLALSSSLVLLFQNTISRLLDSWFIL